MFSSLKRKWRLLKSRKPGERFHVAYDRARIARKKQSPWARIVRVAAAIAALAVGVALSVLPGPAFVFFGLGGVLLASESSHVAQTLDWLELRCRHFGAWAKRRWKSLSFFGRIVVTLLGAGGAAGAFGSAVWVVFLR
jgi:hypothetical protein